MATLSVIRGKILRLLDDPEGAVTSDDILKDAVEAGLEAIMPWAPMRSVISLDYTSGSAGATVFALPSDLYRVEAVYDSEGMPLPVAMLSPDRYRGEDVEINDWIEYPSGCLSFSKALEENVTVLYLANWPKPTTNSSVIPIPDYVIAGLSIYSAAYCLIPGSTSTANIRQWNTKVDSGSPEDNPLWSRVDKLLRLFELEMNRHPAYMRATRV